MQKNKIQVLNQNTEQIEETYYKITGKTLLLLESLMEYYSKNIHILTSIITQKKTLSLRILDWLVTNYAKKHNVVYTIRKNNTNCNFNIYLDYKNQLKAYSKKYFDPFCRRERILIDIQDLSWKIINNVNKQKTNENQLITTVGQLNFFKWFIENNVLNYAIENIEGIDKDMTETLTNSKKQIKRKELSKSASRCICSYDSKIVVNFG
uniref:Uncharacterized protein n=1 Tax=viral metagenome TaxID=1070528 RepID=A0A6C0LER4_9ZZZZ